MQSELEKTYRDGLEQLEKGEWQQAINSFLAVLRLNVDYKAAVAMLKEAQKEEKLENLYKKGETYLQQEAWRSAIETFKEVQGINTGYRDIKKKLREAEEKERLRNLYEQGQEYLANEEWQKAIDSFKKVQHHDPNYPDVVEKLRKAEEQKRLQDLYRRGVEYFRQGMWSNAIEKFNELQKTDHNYPDVAIKLEEAKAQKQMQQKLSDLYSKAKGYEEAGDWQEAIDAYVDILRIDPEYGDVTERLSWINRRRKSSLAGKSPKAHPMVLVWWTSLTPDGKAQVVLGVLGSIIGVLALTIAVLSMPHISGWWDNVAGSDTPTGVSTEIPIPTSTPSSKVCNGNFEADFECWEHGGALNRSVDCSGGNCVALLGDPDYSCVEGVPIGEARICQTFKVPPNGVPKLSFRYRVRSFDILDSVKGGDSFKVYIKKSDANEKMILQVGNMDWNESDCNGDPWDSGWESFSYSINTYEGQNVTLCFHNLNEEDNSWNTWTYVDDVMIIP